MQKHIAIEDIRARLQPFRQLLERSFYTGVEIDKNGCVELWNVLTLIVDDLGAISVDVAAMNKAHSDMLAIAADLDLIGRERGGGYRPGATGVPRGEPPHQGSGGHKDPVVVEFRRLPPRPLYEPAGPGGAA